MADPAKAGEQDQSMEEILQSIKRIIAEEGELPPEPAAPVSAPAPAEPTSFGSDVLELTDIIDEPKPIDPIDTIMAMTQQAEPTPEPEPEPFAAPEPFMETAPAATFRPEPESPAPVPAPALEAEKLMSDIAVEASASALRSLAGSAQHAPHPVSASGASFRSGLTVEDLVIESLKPMLKEWLDEHLPHIVERKVQREIERIARQA